MKVTFFSIILLLTTSVILAQKADYSTLLIADSLKQNANAVIRLEQIDIRIESQRDMTFLTKKAITVLNEKGLSAIGATAYYNKRTSIKNIEATVYNGAGAEIKKLRRRDFNDVSATADGSAIFSDSRVIYLDYTPVIYPFTIVYECEMQTSNTAFIPSWMPLDCFYVSVEKSVLNVSFPSNLGFKKKETNFEGFNIEITKDTPTELSYTATNFPAQKREDYSPDYRDIFPKIMLGLDVFNLEGIDGNAKNWKDFGLWYSDKILTGTTEISDETKAKMKALVGNETDPVKKARIIYNYVQQKSRYISIQVGIGGWKPMPASDVDRLGYGDCKALTNYTRTLLNAVDVPSYNTILYGDRTEKLNIVPDFVSMQGNHCMLAIPNGKDYIWLECTSQDDPFGYQAFTDDRTVLVVKPEGGEIVRTNVYSDKINSQISHGNYAISETGELSGSIAMVSEGSQYRKFHLENMPPTEKEAHYKDYWSNINNLKIKKSGFHNDKEKISFTENLEISAANYGNLSGNRMMIPVNAYNQFTDNIKRIRNRKTPFEIKRGSYDEDEIEVKLPAGFAIESLPKNFGLTSKFGEYKTELVKTADNNLVYKRSLFLKEGLYPNKEYDDFRLFMEQVSRNDNAKIILIKNQ